MLSPAQAISAKNGVVSLSAVDGVLVLSLDPSARFDNLRQSIREMFSQTPDRFRGHDARLDLDSRPIDLFDLRRLVHLLRDEFGVTVTAIYCTQKNLTRFAERELKLKVYTDSPTAAPEPPAREEPPAAPRLAAVAVPATPAAAPQADEEPHLEGGGARLLTLDRPLRSGQKVHYNGDVMIFGDVNPGAEIIASGNILIFGALKGLAHAGARGDEEAVIVSFDFRPTQLRVGKKIALPPEQIRRGSGRVWSPEVAWVQGGQIVIEPYQGRLPR
jgi:septum site-determining protein MinC